MNETELEVRQILADLYDAHKGLRDSSELLSKAITHLASANYSYGKVLDSVISATERALKILKIDDRRK
jgi:hypothetical protein